MDRSKSIETCGKVLAAFHLLYDGEKVETEMLALLSGLTETQVQAAIESMSRGRHPQVEGDRYGIYQVNRARG